ncbi:DUF2711 family protein [Vogesella alkaliphila]|uniref:DUF2716 domain-containing protein n=1 Tax=Vogesella alkaliphila TaxID=1193621 RepID=A0ABQ2YFR6_9NEIS|nr:DUF2711 family protein [Vogesella alkaliphila]GGX81537.1 hypothetical protein GCM10011290_06150 [Vogesella alkaliphila]
MPANVLADKLACFCPQDGYVLTELGGQFSAAYVLLPPFLRPQTLPATRFTPEHYPSREEIVADCHPVSWQSVVTLTGLPDIAAVDLALRTRSLSLRQDLCREDFALQLDQACEQNGLIPPSAGELPDLWHDDWLALLARDKGWLWYGNEFGDACQRMPLTDPMNSHIHARYFSADGSIMLCSHWDSHYSLVCGDREHLLPFSRYEGFYCQPDTMVRWSRSLESIGT